MDWTSEVGCFGFTAERKYYCRDGVFIKRCLKPEEFRTGYKGLHVPRFRKESLLNEAAALQFVHDHTQIPVPKLIASFEHDDAHYLVTEYVDGVCMSDLDEVQKLALQGQIDDILNQLKQLMSDRMGGPTGIIIPPYRVQRLSTENNWQLQPSDHHEYVFCHNDLSQANIIVDPEALKITSVIDWEYAGFYPPFFERPFYLRKGPSVALGGEQDDASQVLDALVKCSRPSSFSSLDPSRSSNKPRQDPTTME